MNTFRKDLQNLINSHSLENNSDTPDFILADYVSECLRTFDKMIRRREEWFGRVNSKGTSWHTKDPVTNLHAKSLPIDRSITSAIYCEHANEMPAKCPCDDDCYCKQHSCKGDN